MKKVFIDTNVVLDYYLDREGFSDDAEAILAYGYNQGCSLYVSSLTCANMAYIAKRSSLVKRYMQYLQVCLNLPK